MDNLSAFDVLKVILEIADTIKYRAMLNERYLHHFFTHLIQEQQHKILNLTEDDAIKLHPEWPTYKESTGLCYGRYKHYKKDLNYYCGYWPEQDGGPGFIDFAIGCYDEPDFGIEFTLSYGWSGEKVVFDCIKLLDIDNPFSTSISFNLVFRKNGLVQKKSLANFIEAMNNSFNTAVDRLKSRNRLCDTSKRDFYLIVTEISKDNEKRHWHYKKTTDRFECGLSERVK